MRWWPNRAADTAVVVLSRFSGEGWDRSDVEYDRGEENRWEQEYTMPQIAGRIFPKGDFYRIDTERTMIEKVCAAFEKVVLVLNVGGVLEICRGSVRTTAFPPSCLRTRRAWRAAALSRRF